jgi:Uma2 family endonuclease
VIAALSEVIRSDGWTTDDIDELPEEGYRCELIDGALVVPPPPTSGHQLLLSRTASALDGTCPPTWEVTHRMEVRISHRRSLVPDVLVVTAEAAMRNAHYFRPDEVVLAVEVVSPGSITMDRVAKPALYAQAGIPFYWRVETEHGIVVHTHELDRDGDVYFATGSFDKVIEIDRPWPVQVPISKITPRFYRPEA